MPIKSGLDFLRRSDGSLIIGNRSTAQKIADRMARQETSKTLFCWHGLVWTGNYYHRISLGGQKVI